MKIENETEKKPKDFTNLPQEKKNKCIYQLMTLSQEAATATMSVREMSDLDYMNAETSAIEKYGPDIVYAIQNSNGRVLLIFDAVNGWPTEPDWKIKEKENVLPVSLKPTSANARQPSYIPNEKHEQLVAGLAAQHQDYLRDFLTITKSLTETVNNLSK